jgi:Zn-dependent membrane protease YugP
MLMFDPLYLVMLLPAMLLSAWAAWMTQARFARWSRVPNARGMSGESVARYILDRNGLSDVPVVPARGTLSDHYDPSQRVVRLSEAVFFQGSVSAMAVAAHETGHAIQHARGYKPLALRSLAVPLAAFGSNIAVLVIIVGLMLSLTQLAWVGVFLFGGTVLFQVVTLPVELDASRRAKAELASLSLLAPGEQGAVSQVLTAAAMTYVGAALSSILTLLYFVLRVSGGSRRD